MPAEQVHRGVAVDCENTSRQLLDINPTWSAVVAFYSALHWVDALLAHELNVHPSDHRARGNYVQRTTMLRSVRSRYERLFVASLQARYQGIRFTRNDASAFLTDDLASIKRVITGVIGL